MTERHVDKLVARAAAGDAKAFGRLYDLYAERVYAFVRGRVGDVHEAEDLTATVFVKAWEAIGSYRVRGLPFGAWLFRIARNAIIDAYRRSARTQEVPVEELGDATDEQPLDEAVIARVDAEVVRDALARLTEEQQSVIQLRFVWDMSIAETAVALGKSEGAIKAMQHRALRAMARHLSEGERE
ncbi:MAG: sigma-70 family RNA polymerase sigma factor [Anaerosomatales bacterium]|nr:sigma-70 family RNA polymerase sigma factor [Anaerosomatales bacterium]